MRFRSSRVSALSTIPNIRGRGQRRSSGVLRILSSSSDVSCSRTSRSWAACSGPPIGPPSTPSSSSSSPLTCSGRTRRWPTSPSVCETWVRSCRGSWRAASPSCIRTPWRLPETPPGPVRELRLPGSASSLFPSPSHPPPRPAATRRSGSRAGGRHADPRAPRRGPSGGRSPQPVTWSTVVRHAR